MRITGLVTLLACVVAVGSANAQGARADYSADDFVKAILTGPQPCPKGMSAESCEANPKTRRFSLAGPSPSGSAPAHRPAEAKPQRGAPRLMSALAQPAKLTPADVLVTFAKGSAEITPQGQANLQSIAAGLNKPALVALQFEIAGFTDVSGSAVLNKALSQQRADAVKAYLTSLSVSPSRLMAVGYGPDHLIDPADPTSEANRRVELHRLN
ncbi:OmpA family protein [Phenylobacterium sp.]|uniref:OmpA family protein n=1 Tax=Phenylobacterium sp. TaxID=1871053 RepID=UPI0025E0BE85|nr:OmpA family protein [Phenylobacterium sp.]